MMHKDSRKKILVLSHERSGTHFLINTLAQNFGYSPQQIDLDNTQRVEWRNSDAASQWLQQFHGVHSPRIFKSHHSHEFLSPLLPQLLDEYHIIYIARDGRDVMTSFWVYLNRLAPGWGPQTRTVGEFMRSRASGGILQYQHHRKPVTMLQRWVEHTEGWKSVSPGIHFVDYETLHSRFETALEDIAAALDLQPRGVNRPGMDSPSSLPWKGTTGTWKEYFTRADEHYFDTHTPARTT